MKVKYEIEITPINDIHAAFVKHFGSVKLAAQGLGYKTRLSIYNIINNGFSEKSKQRIKDAGLHRKFRKLY